MKIAPLAALIAFLVAPAAVIAQAPPRAAAAPADGSSAAPPAEGGSMTLAQFQARNAARMMAADTDGDGRISLAEWTAQMSGRRAAVAGSIRRRCSHGWMPIMTASSTKARSMRRRPSASAEWIPMATA